MGKQYVIRRLTITGILLGLLLSACGGSDNGGGDGEASSVALAWSVDVAWPHFGMAERLNTWSEHNLTPELQRFESGAEAYRALMGGAADFAVVAEFPVTLSILSGEDPRILAVLTHYDNHRVVARADEVSEVSDLAGKQVGTHPGTSAAFFLTQLLETQGLSIRDIELADVPPPDGPSILERGQIDALVSWEPNTTFAEKLLGDQGISLSDREIYETKYSLVTTQEVIEEKPDVVRDVIQVMIEVGQYLSQHKDETIQYLAEETGASAELYDALYDEHDYRTVLDPVLIENMERQAEWAITNDIVRTTDDNLDLGEFIDPSFLREADPDLVQLET